MLQKYVKQSPPVPKIQGYVILVPKKFQYQKSTITYRKTKILSVTSLPMQIVRKSWILGKIEPSSKPITGMPLKKLRSGL